MAIQLKVSPQALKAKSSEISSDISKLQRQWSRIGEVISSTKSYWEGEGSDTHQRYYRNVSDDVTKLLRRLKEHPTDLMKMAGVYDAAEQKASERAGKLPADVIR